MLVQLQGYQEELLVHPEASVYLQLQVGLQATGLVVSAHFGGEVIPREDTFKNLGVESGATVSVVVVGVDSITDKEYAALGAELRAEMEALL